MSASNLIADFQVVTDPDLLKENEVPDVTILNDLVKNNDVISLFADTLSDWATWHASLLNLVRNHGLYRPLWLSGRPTF